MQRFVDRRTSTLLRSLSRQAGPILGGIGADGAVTVEGHVVGRLIGVRFEPERGESELENRALRGAVERVVAPEIARRLGELAAEGDEAFALEGGVVAWRGLAAGEICGGGPFKPRVRLIGEIAADAARERAARRLEAYVAGEASRRLAPLKRLTEAISDGQLKGLPRGVAYQLVERFGILDRRRADEHIRALSRNERRVLKSLGVRFGAFSLYPSGLAYARSAGDRHGVRRTGRAALAPQRRGPHRLAASAPAARGAQPPWSSRGRGLRRSSARAREA